jgi:hypothetical protein
MQKLKIGQELTCVKAHTIYGTYTHMKPGDKVYVTAVEYVRNKVVKLKVITPDRNDWFISPEWNESKYTAEFTFEDVYNALYAT